MKIGMESVFMDESRWPACPLERISLAAFSSSAECRVVPCLVHGLEAPQEERGQGAAFDRPCKSGDPHLGGGRVPRFDRRTHVYFPAVAVESASRQRRSRGPFQPPEHTEG